MRISDYNTQFFGGNVQRTSQSSFETVSHPLSLTVRVIICIWLCLDHPQQKVPNPQPHVTWNSTFINLMMIAHYQPILLILFLQFSTE